MQDFHTSEEENIKDTSNPSADVANDAPASEAQVALAHQLVAEATQALERARQLLGQHGMAQQLPSLSHTEPTHTSTLQDEDVMQVVEGVFDGQKMVGPDGRHYSVPANYASKSKLVEGDLLKLTISDKGAFVYKQIGPIARRRVLGTLAKEPGSSEYRVTTEDRTYRVLTASVTYFRGKAGDEVSIIVPEGGESKWAAVENIITDGEPVTG